MQSVEQRISEVAGTKSIDDWGQDASCKIAPTTRNPKPVTQSSSSPCRAGEVEGGRDCILLGAVQAARE
eukprot:scaffold37053_cov133-Skeletonema_dohrnii-CCMP3373.AAC.3